MRRLVWLVSTLVTCGLIVPGVEVVRAESGSESVIVGERAIDGSPDGTEVQSTEEPVFERTSSPSARLPESVRKILRDIEKRREAFLRRSGLTSSDRSVTGLVVGGSKIEISEAPWQVFLAAGIQYFENDPSSFVYAFFCGGSIIGERWIVTAAHCVENPSLLPYLHVAAGVSSNEGLDSQDFSKVSEILVHPQWDPWLVDNDIALLRLAEPIDLSGIPDAIALPTEVDVTWPEKGTPGMVTGWGANAIVDGWYQYPSDLFKGDVVVLADPGSTACGLYEAFGAYINPDTMLCAGLPPGGVDTCFGDSGGPLAIDVSGEMVLAGITSWGSTDCGAPGFPGMYTRVSTFVPWVESITRAPRGVPIIESIIGANRSLVIKVDASGLVGDPVSNYQYSVNRGRWTTVTPAAPGGEFTIGGLMNGRRYSVRVRAVNDFGKSESSPAVNGTPVAGVPSPAKIDSVISGNRSLRVVFTKPENDGGQRISAYEYSINGGQSWTIVRSTRSPIVISRLRNGVEYTVIIRARTPAGPGEPSEPAKGTPGAPPPP